MKASNAQTGADGAMPLAAAPSSHAWAALAALCLALSVAFAALPVDIGYHLTSDANMSQPPHVIADIGASKAYADAVPVEGAIDLLKEYADVSGLPYGEFVAAVAAIVTSTTGMVTGATDGIMLDSGLERNLSNLVDAADYPDWSTLDAATQSQWGSKENYDAAKFNSLMNAFGFQDVAETYYGSFSAEGGGTFEPGDELNNKLKQIGRIGQRWSMGLGNTYSNVSSLVTDKQAIEQYFGSKPGYGFDATGIPNWPAKIPTYIELGNGSYNLVETYNGKYVTDKFVGVWATDKPVWSILVSKTNWAGSFNDYTVLSFSESTFTYGSGSKQQFDGNMPEPPEVTPTGTPYYRSGINGHSYYWTRYGVDYTLGNVIVSSTLPVNSFPTSADITTMMDIIMANGVTSTGKDPDLQGYPEITPNPDEEIYYPEQGVTTNNTWNNYVTPTPIVRPETPFNPGNQSSTDKFKDDTEANAKGLQGIHFEKVFPFCLLWDVKLVFEKMKQLGTLPANGSDLSTQGAVNDNSSYYLHVKMPLYGFDPSGKYIHEDEGIELDLQPLRYLLLVVRPAFQVLLIVGLLYSLIHFWKGVLFG